MRKTRTAALTAIGAAALMAPGTAQGAEALYGVTDTNQLVEFTSQAPGAVKHSVPITRLQPGESVVGIDIRPATDQLYALGSSSRIYRINTTTGAATAIGGGPFSPTLSGASYGFDFNPTVDRIRVVSDLDQNLRLNPDTGASAATDGPLQYAAGDAGAGMNPVVTASAYTNSVPGATTTQLFGLDSGRDSLVLQNPPNNGTLTTVGALGVDIADANGFDIATSGVAYAVSKVAGSERSTLLKVDLTSGKATAVSDVGIDGALRGLATAGTVADDTRAPAVAISAPTQVKQSTLRSRGLSAQISVSEAASIDARLKLGNRTIGRADTTRDDAGVQRVRITLTSAGKKLLNGRRARKLSLQVQAVDAAGNDVTRRLTINAV